MKDYKVRFHTVSKTPAPNLAVNSALIGPGSLAMGSRGILVNGYLGKAQRLVEYLPLLSAGLAGAVLAAISAPSLAEGDSLLLGLVGRFFLVLVGALGVFRIVRSLLLALLCKPVLLVVNWDEITGYRCLAAAASPLGGSRRDKVLVISHRAMQEASPFVISGRHTGEILQALRRRLPCKEVRAMDWTGSAAVACGLHLCPSCGVRLQIPEPPVAMAGRCGSCKNRFQLGYDRQGRLVIEKLQGTGMSRRAGQSLDDCFQVIGVPRSASAREIKTAYRRRIREYHPDRVAHLGTDLRQLAEQKARTINKAYSVLKDNGLAE